MLRKIIFWLAAIVIFVVPWESGVKIDGFGSLTRVLGFLLTAAWLAMVIIQGKIRKPHPFYLLIIAFFLWNVITALWTVSLPLTMSRLVTYGQLVVLSLLLWDMVVTNKEFRITLQVYVIGAYVSVINLISNYIAEIDFRGSGRYTAFEFNPNELATLLTIAIPIAWYLAVSASIAIDRKSKLIKYVNYIYIGPAVFAILLTGSRNALFSLVPALWFVLGATTQLKIIPKMLIIVVLMGGLISVQGLLPQHTIDRLSSTSEEITSGDLQGREQIWEQGMEEFWDDPLKGVGAGAFEAAIQRGKVAHNTYLSVLAETGAIGMLLFVMIIVTLIVLAVRQPMLLASMWLTILLLWGLGITSKTWEHRKPTWLVFNWIVISNSLVIAETYNKREKDREFDENLPPNFNKSDLPSSAQPNMFLLPQVPTPMKNNNAYHQRNKTSKT